MRNRRFKARALGLALVLAASLIPQLAATSAAGAVTEDVSGWRTWFLSSPDQFRLPAPPREGSAKTTRELRELRRLQEQRDRSTRRTVRKWNTGPATLPWTDVLLDVIPKDVKIRRPGFSARALAYLHTAMYDAVVAAEDSRGAYAGSRRKPAAVDSRIKPLTGGRSGSSYAPVQAAVAGAAETVLPALFPDLSEQRFHDLATEATESRLWAGANYRSDVERARELGQNVGALALERMSTDGSTNSSPPFPRPSGEGYWSETPPMYSPPVAGAVGTWEPWIMSSPDQFRSMLPGPFPYGSPEFLAETREVIEVQEGLTLEQEEIAYFWDDGVGTVTPPGHWFALALDLVRTPGQPGFAMSTQETARAFAYLGVAEIEAAIAAWEAKYFWWSIRPVTAIWRLCDGDSTLCSEAEASSNPDRAPRYGVWEPVIITPAFPSYPSGHATFSGVSGKLLTYFFPAYGDTLNQQAEEAAMSRLYGGIHFRSDNDDGLLLGRQIADLLIQTAGQDGTGLSD